MIFVEKVLGIFEDGFVEEEKRGVFGVVGCFEDCGVCVWDFRDGVGIYHVSDFPGED